MTEEKDEKASVKEAQEQASADKSAAQVTGREEPDLAGDEDSSASDFGGEYSFTADFAADPDDGSFSASSRDSPIGDLASRLFRVGAEAVNQTTGRLREAGEDVKPREILSGAVRMTAKGREELVGLVAKEVRMYLEKLRVGEELRALMTDHSLEVKASFRLKPLDASANAKGDTED